MTSPTLHPARNPRNAKLTEGQVLEIKARLAALPRYVSGRIRWGALKELKLLAQELQVSYSAIRSIQFGCTWKDVGKEVAGERQVAA